MPLQAALDRKATHCRRKIQELRPAVTRTMRDAAGVEACRNGQRGSPQMPVETRSSDCLVATPCGNDKNSPHLLISAPTMAPERPRFTPAHCDVTTSRRRPHPRSSIQLQWNSRLHTTPGDNQRQLNKRCRTWGYSCVACWASGRTSHTIRRFKISTARTPHATKTPRTMDHLASMDIQFKTSEVLAPTAESSAGQGTGRRSRCMTTMVVHMVCQEAPNEEVAHDRAMFLGQGQLPSGGLFMHVTPWRRSSLPLRSAEEFFACLCREYFLKPTTFEGRCRYDVSWFPSLPRIKCANATICTIWNDR